MSSAPVQEPKIKMKDLFKQAEPTLQKWKEYGIASDIFLF